MAIFFALLASFLAPPARAQLVPPAVLVDSPAAFPAELGQVGGEVRLRLLVDEEGQVQQAQLAQASDERFVAAALHAAPGLLFSPAALDGKAVSVWLEFVYRFEPVRPLGARTLAGRVRDNGTGAPLAAAQVVALPEGPAAETDAQGRFVLSLPPGHHRLKVMAAGHRTATFDEQLAIDEQLDVEYRLPPAAERPFQTVVRSQTERVEVSRFSLAGEELTGVPGTMGDPFRVVMALPGVGSVASGVAWPVVRGSAPDSTGYFVDGVRVPILFHLFLGPSVIHPDFIEGLDFYPGNPPPEYARLLGGAIAARTTRAGGRGLRASAYADLINAGLFVESPIAATHTGVSLAGRFSYSPWLVSKVTRSVQQGAERPLELAFYDYQARVDQRLGAASLRLFAFGSSDVASTLVDRDTHAILFHRVDARLRTPLSVGEVETGATWGLDRISYTRRPPEGGETVLTLDTQSLAARAVWTVTAGKTMFRTGGDASHLRSRKDRVDRSVVTTGDGTSLDPSAPPLPPADPEPEAPGLMAVSTYAGAFTEMSVRAAPRAAFTAAMRVDHYGLAPDVSLTAIEPRFALLAGLADSVSVHGAVGIYHQPPSTLLALPVLDSTALRSGLQQSLQASSGVVWKAPLSLEVSADVFASRLLRIVESNPLDGPTLDGIHVDPKLRTRIPTVSREGASTDGWSYGLELMVRRALGQRWFGWLSYTLSESTRRVTFTRYDAFGNPLASDTAYLPSTFDQTHVANLVVSYQPWERWTFGLGAHFQSGHPEVGGLASQTQREGLDPSTGQRQWVPVDRDRADRLPSYFRLDLRVEREWNVGRFVLSSYFDLFNATLSPEIVRYGYGQQAQSDGVVLTKSPQGAVVVLPVLGVKGSY